MAFNISYVYQAVDRYTSVANKINNSVKRTQKKFRRLGHQMDKTNRSMGKFGQTASNVKSRIIALGAALTAATGVKALVDFGFAMSKVEAVSGATNSEFKDMRMLAKDLGATTMFSASEAAGGMEFLARAGFKASSIIKAMPAVLDLAASSSIDLATAADITSNIMTGFGIEASKTNQIADLMATINASANTNVQQLGDAMKFVGPVASGFGQSIEGTAAALGALADAGLQGSIGGTGLRTVLSRLANPSKDMRRIFRALNVDMKKINPVTNDLTSILKELRGAGVDATLAMRLFEQRGGPAFSVMSENIPKIEKLTKKLHNSAGAAKRMADIMKDNLLGAGKETISAFEGLIITMGDLGLTNVLRGLATSLTSIVRVLNFLIERYPRVIKFVALFISILVLGKIAALAYAGAVKAAVIATGAFSIPIVALIALLTTLITMINTVAEDFKQLQQGEHVRQTIQQEIDFQNRQSEIRLAAKNRGVAAQGGGSMRLDGNININAPKGVVSSAETKTSGAGNLGLNMAGAM